MQPIVIKRIYFFKNLKNSKEALVGALILFIFLLSAIFAPYIAQHDPLAQDISKRLMPPFSQENGKAPFYLGTDQLGRDILSRIIYGGRITLFVGFVCACIASVVGSLLGVVAGYFGGKLDSIIMRIADVQLSFPFIILAIALVAVFGPNLTNIVIILGLTSWVRFARVVRADAMLLRELDYVSAAVAIGANHARIVFRHIIPNIISPIIVVATLEIPRMILMEAGLSFLGLGIQPPKPSWGSMASDGRVYINIAWWVTTFPGLAIMLVVLSVNLMGDWLRDELDVRI
jgi:peptide/nickel transport system permease protein